MMKNALSKQKQNIVQKQVAAGREFKVSSPPISYSVRIHFMLLGIKQRLRITVEE